jgi:hypothetical protein
MLPPAAVVAEASCISVQSREPGVSSVCRCLGPKANTQASLKQSLAISSSVSGMPVGHRHLGDDTSCLEASHGGVGQLVGFTPQLHGNSFMAMEEF